MSYIAPDIGEYKFHARSDKYGPGWLLCNGSEVSRTKYAALFRVIGTTFGEGDGSTTFNIPNAEGMVFGMPGGGFTFGQSVGSKANTLTKEQMPNYELNVNDGGHSHGIIDNGHQHKYSKAGSAEPQSGSNTYCFTNNDDNALTDPATTGITIKSSGSNISVSSGGSGGEVNNMQPTIFAGYWLIYGGY